jgi:enolase-phosphatase E1
VSAARPRAILLDVEGTTTAISFVTDVLFPFARKRLPGTLATVELGSALAEAVALLREEWQADGELREEVPEFADGAACALALMDRDRKSTGLKAIQGILWEEGYRNGALRAHVFADVPAALRRWREAGAQVFVFSSGSVLAQRLLFAHSEAGDLGGLLDGNFDTTSGSKREPEAYRRIAEAIGRPPAEVLFLSDSVAELDAASGAGMATGLLERPGNAPVGATRHPRHTSFAGIVP